MAAALTISIIDDDLYAREGIRDLVASLGYRTQTFASAAEFLESDFVATACIITDLQMPGLSGPELQQQLARLGHDIPVIVVTAYPEEKYRLRAMGAGALGVMTKPIDEKFLIHCLNSAVVSRAPEVRTRRVR